MQQDLSSLSTEDLLRMREQAGKQPQGQILDDPAAQVEIQRKQAAEGRATRSEVRDVDNREFDEAQKLRTEYASREAVKTFEAAVGTYASAVGTAANAQGDQSLITAYAKMLDPNSAVREGEFATTAGTENTMSQIKSRIAKEFGLSQGGMLTPDGRERIRTEMRNLVTQRFKPAYDRDRAFYSRLSQELGVDPSKVLIDGIEGSVPKQVVTHLKLSGQGATEESVPLSESFTGGIKELQAGLADGSVTPEQYASYRAGLDRETFGETAQDQFMTYLEEGYGLSEAFAKGASPDDVPQITSATQSLSGAEQAVNDFAQTNTGAFLANMGNAGAAGLPAALTGNQGKLEDLRDNFGGASLGGEIAGGVTGTFLTGGALGAASGASRGAGAAQALGNPLVADGLYGATYGATQDTDNPFRGALIGGTAGALGGKLGEAIGGAFPNKFATSEVRAADASVPSSDALKARASQEYADVEARGVTANPEVTQQMFDEAQAVLRQEGRITPKGDSIDQNTPVSRAMKLLGDFAGEPMTPPQAGSVRKVMAEGRNAMSEGAPDNTQRRLAGMLLEQFDSQADAALPGVSKPRETAQRYLQSDQIVGAREIGDAKSAMFSRSGEENALRNAFRQLDMNDVRGKANFTSPVSQAIQNVTRGTPLSNAARNLGKLAPTGVIPAMGSLGIGAAAGSMTGGLTGALVGAGAMGAGAVGRKVATGLTKRNAELAELIARGGPEYEALLAEAVSTARKRGGLFGGGFAAPTASASSR